MRSVASFCFLFTLIYIANPPNTFPANSDELERIRRRSRRVFADDSPGFLIQSELQHIRGARTNEKSRSITHMWSQAVVRSATPSRILLAQKRIADPQTMAFLPIRRQKSSHRRRAPTYPEKSGVSLEVMYRFLIICGELQDRSTYQRISSQ